MLTTKILSILTLILMPVANVSIVTASQDNKDGYNTNMSDTLKLSDELLSLSLSDSSDSNANSDAEEENNSKITVTTTVVQQTPFQCDEPAIEKRAEQDVDTSFEDEIIDLIDELVPNTENSKTHQ